MFTEYFGLNDEPFRVTPDPRFFFAGPDQERVARQLLIGVREAAGITLLTGPAGSGKTLLLRRLMMEIEQEIPLALVWSANMGFDDFLSTVCVRFGLLDTGASRSWKLHALESLFRYQFADTDGPVLLLDEADNLSDQALMDLPLLTDLSQSGMPLLAVVLAAKEDFAARLAHFPLGQRLGQECHLLPLQRDQVAAYVNHRLRVAGYRGRELFSTEAIDRLAVLSRGIPRLINVIGGKALLMAFVYAERQISAALIDEVGRDMLTLPGSMPLPACLEREISAPEAGKDRPEAAISDREDDVAEDTLTQPEMWVPEEASLLETGTTIRSHHRAYRRRAGDKNSARGGKRRTWIYVIAGGGVLLGGVIFVSLHHNAIFERLEITEQALLLPDPVQQADGDGRDSSEQALDRPFETVRSESTNQEKGDSSSNENEGSSSDSTLPSPRHVVEPDADISSVNVARAQFTYGVRGREPIDRVGPIVHAEEKDIKRLYYFMELTDMGGETITHRWLYEGQIMAEIPFRIGGNHWRIYSSKDLAPSMTGRWQVIVTNSQDETIKTSSFIYRK